jgi:tetratricopeptide (TPR) repeat protein/transcriptional regulator with XRE-family HTH domain
MTTPREPGQRRKRYKLAEARSERGWSQERAASEIYQLGIKLGYRARELGVDTRMVSGWEGGAHHPKPHYVRILCRLYGRPEELIDLAPYVPSLPGDVVPDDGTMAGGGRGTASRSTRNHGESPADQEPGSSADEDDMKRRAFLRWMSVAATNVALGPIDADDRDSNRLDRSVVSLPVLDKSHLDQYTRANTSLWAAFGAAHVKSSVLPSVQTQIRMLTRGLQQSHSTEQHGQLCALAGDVFQLAGEVFFDVNRYSEAAQYYAAAIDVSKDASAHDLWACAITRHAFIAIYDHQFRDALPLLDAAVRVARRGDGTLSTRHWVQAVAAEALAGVGDLAACQRALDRAEHVHDLGRPASNGGWLRFDGSRLAEQRGACFTKLERPELAQPALQEALRLDLSARRRGLVLADLALVALQRHEIDEACGYGEQAIEIAKRGASGVIKRRLVDLRTRLDPFGYTPAVKHFIQHLASL